MTTHKGKQGRIAMARCSQLLALRRRAMQRPANFIDILCIRQVKVLIHMPFLCLAHVPELFLLCRRELCEDSPETGVRCLQSEELQQSGLCLIVTSSRLSAVFCA
jgi:hypothetical protein